MSGPVVDTVRDSVSPCYVFDVTSLEVLDLIPSVEEVALAEVLVW